MARLSMARFSMTRWDPVRQQALSVSLATGAYALSFGALSVAAGLDVWQTCALSLLLFTGGSQFAFVGIIGAGGSPLAAVATSTLLSVRNAFYGAALAPVLRPLSGWRKAWTSQLTIDESTAVALAQDPDDLPARRTGFWWTGVGIYVGWNAVTLLGALLGQRLGDPAQWGLDGAAVGAFLALLWPRLATRQTQVVAAAAALIALALTPVLPAGLPILAAAVAAIAAGWRAPRRNEQVTA